MWFDCLLLTGHVLTLLLSRQLVDSLSNDDQDDCIITKTSFSTGKCPQQACKYNEGHVLFQENQMCQIEILWMILVYQVYTIDNNYNNNE